MWIKNQEKTREEPDLSTKKDPTEVESNLYYIVFLSAGRKESTIPSIRAPTIAPITDTVNPSTILPVINKITAATTNPTAPLPNGEASIPVNLLIAQSKIPITIAA